MAIKQHSEMDLKKFSSPIKNLRFLGKSKFSQKPNLLCCTGFPVKVPGQMNH